MKLYLDNDDFLFFVLCSGTIRKQAQDMVESRGRFCRGSTLLLQYNTVQYNTTIPYNAIQLYNTIQYKTIQYNTIQDNTIQDKTRQYYTRQYNTTI